MILILKKILDLIKLDTTIRDQEWINDEMVQLSSCERYHVDNLHEWVKTKTLLNIRNNTICNNKGFCEKCPVYSYGYYCFGEGSKYGRVHEAMAWSDLIISHSKWIGQLRTIRKYVKRDLFKK
jgi:hypothetical protein